jgi:hypothetical protein
MVPTQTMDMAAKPLIHYAEALELLQTHGLRYRQARTALQKCIPTLKHSLHTQKLWHRQAVIDFAVELVQYPRSLGRDEAAITN